jgi:DNA-directed RNA polymerase specialized sigma24 family protein
MDDSTETDTLLHRAADGDQEAVAVLFAQHRDRLARMVRLRMDRRLQARIDPSDVLQETYLEAARRVAEFARAPTTSVCEVLALRHFEPLSNGEVAEVLGLSKAAASNRYVRALKRLKEILSAVPGLGARCPGQP